MTAARSELARAKINLTLRVLGRRPDGYHELVSLVAFARCGDLVTLDTSVGSTVRVVGPYAGAIDGPNLLECVLKEVGARYPGLRRGAVTLDKRLPVAAGLGGGSADAAALLRLLTAANPDHRDHVDWDGIATSLGADVPVCLRDRPALMWGIGEHVRQVPDLPEMGIVLANPGVPLSTASVFKHLAAAPVPAGMQPPPLPTYAGNPAALIDYMQENPNDLEPAARALCPQVVTVLAALSALDDALIARMSGSGATCFALFADAAAARDAATRLTAAHPSWWIAASTIG